MRAHAIGIRAIEQRGIGGHAKTARNRLPDTLHRYLVPALAANRKIVMLALAVQVNGECKVFAGLEGSKLYLTFSVHLDGQREHHDFSVCREGGYEIAANRKIVMLALAVQVNGECKVFAGLEGSKFFRF